MSHIWIALHWVSAHWKQWGLPGIILASGTTAAGIYWLFLRIVELRTFLANKTAKEIDARVLEALGNPQLWSGPRAMTGAGYFAVRTDELAEALKLKEESVFESLERLEERSRVRNMGANLMDPTCRWHLLPR